MDKKMTLKALGVVVIVAIVLALLLGGKETKDTSLDIEVPQLSSAGDTSAEITTPPKPKSPAKATIQAPKPIVSGEPKELILDLSSAFARTYEEKLSEYLDKPADFNGHYIVARWDCGNGCMMGGIIDTENGKVFIAPRDNYQTTTPAPFMAYSVDRNLFKVVNDDVLETYEFVDNEFVLVNIEQL